MDTQQHIVGGMIVFFGIVDIIGRHQTDACLFSDSNDLSIRFLLLGDAVILKLQIEVIGSKQPVIVLGGRLGPRIIPPKQLIVDLALQTAR